MLGQVFASQLHVFSPRRNQVLSAPTPNEVLILILSWEQRRSLRRSTEHPSLLNWSSWRFPGPGTRLGSFVVLDIGLGIHSSLPGFVEVTGAFCALRRSGIGLWPEALETVPLHPDSRSIEFCWIWRSGVYKTYEHTGLESGVEST